MDIYKYVQSYIITIHRHVSITLVKIIRASNNQCTISTQITVQKFDVHVTVHRVKFLVMKPTTCTNFSNLFLKWNSTCFGQFLCPPSGVFHCKHGNGICHTGLLTACEQDQDGTAVPSCSASSWFYYWNVSRYTVTWTSNALYSYVLKKANCFPLQSATLLGWVNI